MDQSDRKSPTSKLPESVVDVCSFVTPIDDWSFVRDSSPHDGRNSWVESTMEVRLGHFIDPTHQGGQPHGGFFGNGKL